MRRIDAGLMTMAMLAVMSGCQRPMPLAVPVQAVTQAQTATKSPRLQDSGTVTQVRRDSIALESAVGDKWFQFAPDVQVTIFRKDRQLVPGRLTDLKAGQEVDLWGPGEWQGNRRVVTEVWIRYGHPLNP